MSDTRQQLKTPRDRTEDGPDGIQTMHDVFSNWERRAILYYLQEREDRTSVERIARQLVGWRRGRDDLVPEEDEDVERTRIRVVYKHVMKMAEFGILSYRPRTDTVELSDGMQVSVSPPWHEDDAPSDEP